MTRRWSRRIRGDEGTNRQTGEQANGETAVAAEIITYVQDLPPPFRPYYSPVARHRGIDHFAAGERGLRPGFGDGEAAGDDGAGGGSGRGRRPPRGRRRARRRRGIPGGGGIDDGHLGRGEMLAAE